ncbi:hypothetical protein I4552_19790 [Klebsiella michiganensis]|uniref:hypothetical protein n=1 Tax=Klebsiella/Raoultella group TaxID=2890311 RepID=UPI0015E58F4D|nr:MULTISPECIES: hypothetical protein [Klebsiella]MBG2619899.1 hypothetical protein [Klebsiella michiganensis]MBG2633244.1 hypothetical protein [Klebsiella michiganensis]MDM9674028.1 hypothetical protein [Raoultella planticola]QLO77626.1 hypothetical protein HV306_11235 [Klebsiella grimontii]
MQCVQNNQQFNFFSDNTDVTTNPMVISSFLNALSKFGLIPTFGQELNALTGEKKQVLIMTNPEQTYKIEFPSHAVIISGVGMNVDEYNARTIDVLGALGSLMPNKKANRLAVINAAIYSGTQEQYQSTYAKLFTYKDIEPFEWENRVVQRFNTPEVDVDINHVSVIRRCTISSALVNSGRDTDVIMFENDTNTIREASAFRYDWNRSIELFKSLSSINASELAKAERYTK